MIYLSKENLQSLASLPLPGPWTWRFCILIASFTCSRQSQCFGAFFGCTDFLSNQLSYIDLMRQTAAYSPARRCRLGRKTRRRRPKSCIDAKVLCPCYIEKWLTWHFFYYFFIFFSCLPIARTANTCGRCIFIGGKNSQSVWQTFQVSRCNLRAIW